MNAKKAADNIWWVGALDPDIRVFDIVMYTEHGTTYNSYLVRGEKTVLIETVKDGFFDGHLSRIKEICDPAEIDYIVANHTEPDHTGSLFRLLELAPNATVLASPTAITFLKEIVNAPFPHRAVTEKDVVDLGGLTLRFLSVPMLHWPDTMYTYIPELGALFTCDSFGCHYSDERVFNDLITGDFYDAYKYYFDNIIGPYKNPHMLNALKKLEGLDIRFVGNGHGPVLRADIRKYLDLYREWSTPAEREGKRAVVAYVSAYGYTAQIAGAIADGITGEGVKAQLYDLVTCDNDAARAAIADADGFLLGSPTIVGDALPPVYGAMLSLNPVIHRGKKAGAFGSYGWSGEAVPNLMARMKQLKLDVTLDGLKIRFKPSDGQIAQARDFGAQFARSL